PGLEAEKLGMEIAGLDADRRPGSGDQGGFQPGAALAYAGGAAFAGTLIIARAKSCPRDQMGWVGKARHVDADLRHDDLSDEITDPGHGRQQACALLDRRQGFSQSSVDLTQSLTKCGNEIEVQLDHGAMVRRDPPAQCLDQLAVLASGGPLGKSGQFLRVVFAGDNGCQHGLTGSSQYV